MTRGILLNGPERRRKWHDSQRREIVSLAFSPGSSVTEVARQFDVATSLIYRWRDQFLAASSGVSFSPAILADGPAGAGSESGAGLITVDFKIGARVSIGAGASLELVSAIMKSLR